MCSFITPNWNRKLWAKDTFFKTSTETNRKLWEKETFSKHQLKQEALRKRYIIQNFNWTSKLLAKDTRTFFKTSTETGSFEQKIHFSKHQLKQEPLNKRYILKYILFVTFFKYIIFNIFIAFDFTEIKLNFWSSNFLSRCPFRDPSRRHWQKDHWPPQSFHHPPKACPLCPLLCPFWPPIGPL